MKNTKYSRQCPKCNKNLFYTQNGSCKLAKKRNSLCGSCRSSEVQNRQDVKQKNIKRGKALLGPLNPFYGKHHSEESKVKRETTIQQNNSRQFFKDEKFLKKRSELSSGQNNPMYGKNLQEIWVLKYGSEEACRRRGILSQKRSVNTSGKRNPMYGKSAPYGSGGGWSGWYNGWYFRSLRELTYVLKELEPNNRNWVSAEDMCIPYSINGVDRTYRPDFRVNDEIIEIKPRQMQNTIENLLKRSAATAFCQKNGMRFRVVDINPITIEELWELHQNGTIKLLEKWSQRICRLMKKKT